MISVQEKFEVWAKSRGYSLEMWPTAKRYMNPLTRAAWDAWPASRQLAIDECAHYIARMDDKAAAQIAEFVKTLKEKL